MRYWLMKSEPSTFSIDDLARAKNRTTMWDGVRNYQARNFLREMRKGDLAFFYHSSCAVPGVVGIVAIVREAYPDPTAFDPNDDHYDPKSDPAKPRWYAVDVKLEEKFDDVVPLETLRAHEQGALRDMVLLRKGNRLSVTPVTKSQWSFINALAKRKR
ncbi:MAG: EVE domain-containing protein [Gammaproteobacteria bacterium]|nr:EVE domain-containing protein [Gammaproteobacteria bacterium]